MKYPYFKSVVKESLREAFYSKKEVINEVFTTRYMFFIRNGKIEIYPVKYSKFSGVETYVNKGVHKYFRFKKEDCYETPEEANKAAEEYIQKKDHDPSLNEMMFLMEESARELELFIDNKRST